MVATNADLVVFRDRFSRTAVAVVVLVPVVLVAVIVGGGVQKSGTEHLLELVLVAAVFVAVLYGVAALVAVLTSRPHTWDLAAGTITARRRTYAFAEVGRVVLCTGAKGWRGVLVCTRDGRPVHALTANVRGSIRAPMGREQWRAIRVLLTAPHAPTLEEFGPVRWGANDVTKRPSKVVLRGRQAVEVVDAQIAWIDAGGDPSSGRAPIEQFRGRRPRR